MAVVSQPWDRSAMIKAPGKVDASLGEFWSENPWDIVSGGHNLSAYERKRTFLNIKGKDFLDISFLTGSDNDGDGRCVVAGDFRNIGQMDLVVRQNGGGPLYLYENHFPKKHYLKVSLRGRQSNRLGIGARLIAEVKGQQLVRELYPINTFHSQAASLVHFGLGDSTQVNKLTIQWPSGKKQVITGIAGDRHIILDEGLEGGEAVETVVPGTTIKP